MLSPAQLLEIELTFFSHQSDIFVIGKECYQFLSLFFGFLLKGLSLALIVVDKAPLDLLLKIFTLRTDIGLEKVKQKMRVHKRS